MEFLGHMVVLPLIFWVTAILLFLVTVPFYISINNAQGFRFFHIFTSLKTLAVFWFCFIFVGFFVLFFQVAILMGVRWCLIDLTYISVWWYLASFHVLVGHLYIFGEMSVEVFCPFLIRFFLVKGVLYIFWILTTY